MFISGHLSLIASAALLLGSQLLVSAFNLPPDSKPAKIVGHKGHLFVDEFGRSRILRGTNVVYKGPPWHPDLSEDAPPRWSFNSKDINILAEHGVTAIRLGVMWPGVEPVRGQYNYTYLDTMATIVENLNAAGIYVLIEMHQDALSEKFCGEGVPLWAAQPADSLFNLWGFPFPYDKPYKLQPNGVPTPEDCAKHWIDKYQLSYAAGSAYERLYKNHDGLRDAFRDYWNVVVKRFKQYNNVLGYEIMNEPFAGNAFTNPGILVPGVADRLNLQDFYDEVSKGIRAADPDALIFFEPVTWNNFIVGFDTVPGGNGNIIARTGDMLRLGCGGMLTEFEMGWQDGRNVPEIKRKAQAADNFFVSYTGWEYTDYIPITGTNNGIRDPANGEIRPDMAAVYSRTYATSIAGLPLWMNFDDDTGVFTLKYVHDEKIKAPTEVRINRVSHYPQGVNVQVKSTAGEGTFKVEMDKEAADVKEGFFVYVRPDSERVKANLIADKSIVTVTVTRK
ncbi:hypothetical protein HDV05_005159 [Chytridiales sp. JEL 0842]|nr:hypothetical protein HDV05_005159 [Chytridiales sp. JEL 0842]